MMNFFNLPLWLAITMLTTETHWETILILLVTEFPELYTTNREQSDKWTQMLLEQHQLQFWLRSLGQ